MTDHQNHDTEAAPTEQASPPTTELPPATNDTPELTQSTPRQPDNRYSLAILVGWGTIAVVVVGAILFGWMAWLLSHRAAPWNDPDGSWAWLSNVNGAELFDSARTAATILAVVGVGGAALVAYRRQDVAEKSHRTAEKQLVLDSEKYELDRKRHQLDEDRRDDDRKRELRARFATIADQLGSDNYALRLAGAYALRALADDWKRLANEVECQVCVDLLCAQLRRPRRHDADDPDVAAADLQVRQIMVALIRSRRPLTGDVNDGWRSCSIDLSGADLSTVDLSDTDLSGADLDKTVLTQTSFSRSDLSGSRIRWATLVSTRFEEADLTDANLIKSGLPTEVVSSGGSYFNLATMRSVGLWETRLSDSVFSGADLTDARAYSAQLVGCDFEGAKLVNAKLQEVDFSRSDLSSADLRGANLDGTNFTDIRFDGATQWPENYDLGSQEPVDGQPDESSANGLDANRG